MPRTAPDPTPTTGRFVPPPLTRSPRGDYGALFTLYSSSDTESATDGADGAEGATSTIPLTATQLRDARLLVVGLRGEPRRVAAEVLTILSASADADEFFERAAAAGLGRLWHRPPPPPVRVTPAAPPPTAATAAAWGAWLTGAGLVPGPAALAAAAGAATNAEAAARMAGAVMRAAADAHAAGEMTVRGVERLTVDRLHLLTPAADILAARGVVSRPAGADSGGDEPAAPESSATA